MKCHHNPVDDSKYMGRQKAQIPLRITPELVNAATYMIENVASNSGYQCEQKYKAAERWIRAVKNGEYVWLSVAGAATPVGLGGLFADAIALGLVDAVVCTGANAYHDLHFACGLPVRHGEHKVDDEKLRDDDTTRIYTQYIHADYTLKTQDTINQDFARKILPRLKPPFSTATLLNELGKEMLNDYSGTIIDKEGSFVVRAAKYDVPVFLDSGSNHSLGMDLSLLHLKGMNVDTSPSRDIIEAAALSTYTQPQVNVFLGEGGPRNFTQTTAPTAAEIFYLNFEGSNTCIKLTTSDERTGGLSGSGEPEGVSWRKYIDAAPEREIEIWGEYTLTAPDLFAYVAGHCRREPRRLMCKRDEIVGDFLRKVKKNEPKRIVEQEKLRKMLPYVIAGEKEARIKAGYTFGVDLFI